MCSNQKNETSILSDNPIEFCLSLQNKGVKYLQIVDLDGVFSGETKIFDLLKEIKETLQIHIQFGGGIRDFKTAKKSLILALTKLSLGLQPSTIKNFLLIYLKLFQIELLSLQMFIRVMFIPKVGKLIALLLLLNF